MDSVRSLLLEWARQGRIPPTSLKPAFGAAGALPGRAEWLRFLDRLLLWLGVLAFTAGVILFFAYNWAALHRFTRLGLAAVLLAASVAGVKVWGLDRLPGQAALVAAALLTGALLALIGQIYQTGADPYTLFALWAGLILPWTLLGRLPALWALWLVVANLALSLYFLRSPSLQGFLDPEATWLLSHALFNGGALFLWEVGARRGIGWMADRWPPRLVAAVLGAPLTLYLVIRVFAEPGVGPAWLVWVPWLAGTLGVYRGLRQDLVMLAGALFAGIVVVAALLVKGVVLEAGGLGGVVVTTLFTGIVVVLLSGGAGAWLRQETGFGGGAGHG